MTWLGDAWMDATGAAPLRATAEARRAVSRSHWRRLERLVARGMAAEGPADAQRALLIVRSRQRREALRGPWALPVLVVLLMICVIVVAVSAVEGHRLAAAIYTVLLVWFCVMLGRVRRAPERTQAAEAANLDVLRRAGRTFEEPDGTTAPVTRAQRVAGSAAYAMLVALLGGTLARLLDGASLVDPAVLSAGAPTAVGATIGICIVRARTNAPQRG